MIPRLTDESSKQLSRAALMLTSTLSADITPAEARTIAKEAHICGFPMVDGCRISNARAKFL